MTEEPKKDDKNNKLEELKKDLGDAKAKCEEYLNGWKRERADFLNYKKEETERISQLAKYANEEIILKIIPILDNICLAESHVPEDLAANDWIQGFLQIKRQLSDFLVKEGIEHIEVLGKEFDPNFMESVGEASKESGVPDSAEPGIVTEEVQRGYTMHGKLIRAAKVRVTK